MPYGTGKYKGAGIALETVSGTYEDPTVFLPNTKATLDPNISDESLDVNIGKATTKYLTYRKQAEPNGEIDMPVWPENGMEQLLKCMIGSATSLVQGATTAYLHTYTEGTEPPTFSVTTWNEKLGTVEAMPGCTMNSLEISYDGPGVISMAAKFDGANYDTSKTKPTITLSTAQPFNWGQLSALIDGTQNTTVTKASISITRSVDKHYGAKGDGNLAPNILVPNPLDISGSIEYPKADNSELNKYLDGASAGSGTDIGSTILNRTLALNLTGPTIADTYKYGLNFAFPRVNMTKIDPDGDDDKTLMNSLAWDALYDEATDKTLTCTSTSKLTAIT